MDSTWSATHSLPTLRLSPRCKSDTVGSVCCCCCCRARRKERLIPQSAPDHSPRASACLAERHDDLLSNNSVCACVYACVCVCSPGNSRQVGHQPPQVFLLYSVVVTPGRKRQDWSSSFIPPTCTKQTVRSTFVVCYAQ